MFHILGFIFFFILIILVIGLVVLSKVVRTIFGLGRHMTGSSSTQRRSQTYQRSTSSGYRSSDSESRNSQQSAGSASGRKKIFDSDEGEYIDFEEVKES